MPARTELDQLTRKWNHPLTTAALSGLAGVFGSYAVAGPTPRFVVVPVNSALVDNMPETLITFSILVLGDAGKFLGFALGIVATATLFALVTVVARLFTSSPLQSVCATAVLGSVFAVVLTRSVPPSLGAGISMGLLVGLRRRLTASGWAADGRRRVLKRLIGGSALGVLAGVIGNRQGGRTVRSNSEDTVQENPVAPYRAEVERELSEARARTPTVTGFPEVLSAVDDFYEVDINTINPDVAVEDWELQVTGAVENELTFSYEELLSRTPEHRLVTLRCVSDELNGDLMDTALWTGVPVRPILELATPQSGCECLMLHAVDGYDVEFPLEAFETGLLAFGMNGEALPRQHGYPVRALVPGHWGETNLKWLTEIEVLERERDGYWERRGWHGTGPVHTVAKIWTVNRRDDGRLTIGGYAYAGTRGVSKVEFIPDIGDDWREATLGDPLPGNDVWRPWTYEWTPPDTEGTYTAIARATDGDGNLQGRKRSDPHPSGATGYARRTITIGDAGDPSIT